MQSTHPMDRLQVTLGSGETVPVIFKRLRAESGVKGGRQEVLIYRNLLAERRFGAPLLYASLFDEAQGRYWLFLEDVGEGTLNGADFPDWLAAVRWLAEMHGTNLGREDELRALGCLGEHGPDYYRSLLQIAREHLERASPRPALARFDRLMEGFPDLVAEMVRQPRTLVHGDVFPHNVHLQPGPTVRPIDWESAALGAPLWDLARLLDGWGSDKPAFLEAYLAELARHTGAKARWATSRRAWRCCDILNVLWHIAWDEAPCRDPELVDSCLGKIEATFAKLRGDDSAA
jgi:aminoglycoside/choline kinase family phosphotransferase